MTRFPPAIRGGALSAGKARQITGRARAEWLREAFRQFDKTALHPPKRKLDVSHRRRRVSAVDSLAGASDALPASKFRAPRRGAAYAAAFRIPEEPANKSIRRTTDACSARGQANLHRCANARSNIVAPLWIGNPSVNHAERNQPLCCALF